MATLWHRINLNVLGGVESLWREFVARSATIEPDWRQGVLVQGKVHPYVREVLDESGITLISRKYVGGFKLPRRPASLRQWHVRHSLRRAPPDVLLSWSAFAKPDLVELASEFGARLLYYEHGSAWGEHDARRVARFLAATEGVIANSRAAKRVLQLRWGYEGPIAVIPNGLRGDIAAQPAPPRSAPAGRIRLGMACRLESIKGIPIALQALSILVHRMGVDAELKVAGEGRELSSLRALADRLNVLDRVRFLGTVRAMMQFYDEIDLLLAPSLRESFGMVSIEAQARGCPVVVAAIDGLPETVLPDRTGLIVAPSVPLSSYCDLGGDSSRVPERMYDPAKDSLRLPLLLDPEDLAGAVCDIVGDAGRYERFSRQAIAWVDEQFGLNEYVARMHSFLTPYMHGYAHQRIS